MRVTTGKVVNGKIEVPGEDFAEGIVALSHDEEFIEIINRSWEGYKKTGGTSLEELCATYGLVA